MTKKKEKKEEKRGTCECNANIEIKYTLYMTLGNSQIQ